MLQAIMESESVGQASTYQLHWLRLVTVMTLVGVSLGKEGRSLVEAMASAKAPWQEGAGDTGREVMRLQEQ